MEKKKKQCEKKLKHFRIIEVIKNNYGINKEHKTNCLNI